MAHGRTLVVGETLVDVFPADGDAPVFDAALTPRPGGAPFNVAAGLAGLGAAPLLWTSLGDDAFADALAAEIADRGIPDDLVQRRAGATALALVGLGSAADGFVFYHEGTATTRLDPPTDVDAALGGVDRLYLGGVLLAMPAARPAIRTVLAAAADRDCTVFFDPNYRADLWADDDYRRVVGEILESVDVLKVSDEDARPLGVDADAPAGLADALLDRGPDTVIVTLGAEGAYARARADAPWGPAESTAPTFDVAATDPTGAGDAFTAGVLHGLGDGPNADLGGTLRLGSAAGATVAGREGALPPGRFAGDVAELLDGDVPDGDA